MTKRENVIGMFEPLQPSDNKIEQVACDEMQQDWNDIRYKKVYHDGFVDGSKWVRDHQHHIPTESDEYKKMKEDRDCLWEANKDLIHERNELSDKLEEINS